MRRLFIDGTLTEYMIIEGDDARHLLYAMRVKPGQRIVVADKKGIIAETEIIKCEVQRVFLHLLHKLSDQKNESDIEIVLVQCLPKGDKMDYIVQKAAELGVNKIIPVMSCNCVVRYDLEKREKRQQKWQKIAEEASKQCGRGSVPQIAAITDLSTCLDMAEGYNACICYENEKHMSLNEYLKNHDGMNYMLFIGPEGGFTLDEAARCKIRGINSISLGNRILRTETAALAAVTIVQYEKGDLGNQAQQK
ncbi:16S rRNA (uracil(1498)-N(3))-methyltransferase [Pectinatus frisingensis]|uniref:16S rRNA (uracil(1498)-N(3))-methyltransferase n=1 Tax=Pectinatus frisingensis TaxID=865 RepID=UPI0018C78F86|nr:16S rRNA (uracil(1498)-N(3))-methyltransferase [Pectinatus frisingensis]